MSLGKVVGDCSTFFATLLPWYLMISLSGASQNFKKIVKHAKNLAKIDEKVLFNLSETHF